MEKELYSLWINNAREDQDLMEELESIKNNDDEIYDRFYRELEFGTAGLRGVIGAGTNRMNIYTVRLATQGLANYLKENYSNSSVAIAYDSRIKSELFAKEAACVLAANGIHVHLTSELQPTPVLSFAVREFSCHAGIMITASHNPAKYNGYKCYGEDGCQMTEKSANAVYSQMKQLDIFNDIKTLSFEQALSDGMIKYIDESFYDKYLQNVQQQSINKGICIGSSLKVIYTPLNGAGNKLVRKILSQNGINNVIVVPEQENPDGNFPTCPYPNPEIREALKLGLELAEKEDADLLLATDPDSDRVGIAVKDTNGYKLMTGNEVGIMLINYILSCRKSQGTLPKNPVAIRTIVSSKMIDKIADRYDCETRTVLTGFKYIGEQILNLEKNNESSRFVFGFEESYGYLVGTYVRDKDAVVASMLICEMAAYYQSQGKSLARVMDEIYNEYGFYKNTTLSFNFEGAVGMEKMKNIMSNIRENCPKNIANIDVIEKSDYLSSKSINLVTGKISDIDLPKSNVISLSLKDESAVIVRPSGTEPKIKLYITSVGQNMQQALEIEKKIEEHMSSLLK